jgi:hypothetical protein
MDEDGVTMDEFVAIMQDHLPVEALGAASEVVECLCELFVEVDLNGDGRMQWEEFTAFIIDNGMVERDGAADGLKGYSRVNTPPLLQVSWGGRGAGRGGYGGVVGSHATAPRVRCCGERARASSASHERARAGGSALRAMDAFARHRLPLLAVRCFGASWGGAAEGGVAYI